MNHSVWSDRIGKMTNKMLWSAQSHLIAKPQVEFIQQRNPPGEPEDFEYVKRCLGPAYIEPEFGYIISGAGSLIEETMHPNDSYPIPTWRLGLPSAPAFFKARHGMGKRIEHYPKVISLRHFWEWNYYHFYMDVLGKIQLFDVAGIDRDTPLVLGRYAMELPYVQQIIKQGNLKQRNWIIQDKCYVAADEIYYCRTKQLCRDRMVPLMDSMMVPNHRDNYSDRIFLARKMGVPRSVTNMNQIEPILREYGFQIVETSALSIAEQIEFFSKTRYLIAVHGAGMTNMIFRRDAPMSLLELHPANYAPVCYLKMCQELGYQMDRLACQISGSSEAQHADISVDPIQLRQKLDLMLTN